MLIQNPKYLAIEDLYDFFSKSHKANIVNTLFKQKTLIVRHKGISHTIALDFDKTIKTWTKIPFWWSIVSTIIGISAFVIFSLSSSNIESSMVFGVIILSIIVMLSQYSFFIFFSPQIKEFREELKQIV
ncbi:MAG: hypothetical protein JXL97_14430 [Bacteroidales bacterium]|nr:hypothetical protein [Bacteroidales bacterium]